MRKNTWCCTNLKSVNIFQKITTMQAFEITECGIIENLSKVFSSSISVLFKIVTT